MTDKNQCSIIKEKAKIVLGFKKQRLRAATMYFDDLVDNVTVKDSDDEIQQKYVIQRVISNSLPIRYFYFLNHESIRKVSIQIQNMCIK